MLSFVYAIILVHGYLFRDALYFRSMIFGRVSGLSIVSRCWDPGLRITHSDEKQRSGDLLVGCWLACRYEEIRDSGTKWYIQPKGGRPLSSSLSTSTSLSKSIPFFANVFPRKPCKSSFSIQDYFSSIEWKFHLFIANKSFCSIQVIMFTTYNLVKLRKFEQRLIIYKLVVIIILKNRN